MGRLRLTEVLDSYDGPRLLLARSEIGVEHLGLWIEDVLEGNVWLFVPLSEERRLRLLDGTIPLRDAYLEAEDGFVLRVITPRDGGSARWAHVARGEVDRDDLPPEDDFLDLHPRVLAEALARDVEPAGAVRDRLLERIYNGPTARGRRLGQDVVASTWAAWFSCRNATIRARGPGFSDNVPPAVGAAVHSFAVDLSVPKGEANIRAISDWIAYVRGAGIGDARQRMVTHGIDSQACETLLSNVAGFEVTFRVTLLWPDGSSPALSFEINPELARRLLRELRAVLPVLGSDKIPQANSLDKIVAVVEGVRLFDRRNVI